LQTNPKAFNGGTGFLTSKHHKIVTDFTVKLGYTKSVTTELETAHPLQAATSGTSGGTKGAARTPAPEANATFAVDTPERYRPVETAPRQTITTPLDASHILGHNIYVNESARIFTNPFEETDMALDNKRPWHETLGGRVGMQVVARSLSAATFALGCYMLNKWEPGKKVSEQHVMGKLPEAIASNLDKYVTPIFEKVLSFTGKSPAEIEHIMTFNKFLAKSHMVQEAMNNPAILNKKVYGMTMGQEWTDRTLQFALGSVGASVGIEVCKAVDPGLKKEYIDEDGKLDPVALGKYLLKRTWRIVMHDQMRDWAAGLPYIWDIRATRALMDNGFLDRHAKDSAMWGLQNNDNGTTERAVIQGEKVEMQGSMLGTGIFDFQRRFPDYNTYTMMYSDVYNHLSHVFSKWQEQGWKVKLEFPENPLHTVTHGLKETIAYVIKTFVKTQAYMNPVMLTFWPMRTSIGKGNHMMVNQETGMPITTVPTYDFNPGNLEQWNQPFRQGDATAPHGGIFARPGDIRAGTQMYSGKEPVKLHIPNYNPYRQPGKSRFEAGINRIGEFGANYANGLTECLAPLLSNLSGISHNDATDLVRTAGQTQMNYIFYMIAKNEMAQLADTPVWDAIGYAVADAILELKPGKLVNAVKDMGRAMTGQQISEENAAHVGEHRGLVNSRYEAQQSTAETQAKLRHARIEAKAEKELQQAIQSAETPSSQVQEPLHHGATVPTLGAVEKQSAANNIVRMKRTQQPDWQDYTAQRAQEAEKQQTLALSTN
jgi:hypothetical protein